MSVFTALHSIIRFFSIGFFQHDESPNIDTIFVFVLDGRIHIQQNKKQKKAQTKLALNSNSEQIIVTHYTR